MNHLNAITAQLDAYQLDALCITSQPGEYYAVGLKGEGVVLVTRQGCHYFTDSRYIELAQNTVTNADVTMVTPHQDHLALASLVLEHYGLKRVGIEEAYLTVERWQKMKTAFPADTELVPAGKLLTELRSAKTEEELAVMQKAQDITDQVFAEICDFLHAGVTESEVAAQLTYLQMKHGAEGNSFPPIVASGANGSMPHAIPTAKPIQKGEFVTMDFGCIYQGYCSDMTRTVAIGQPSDEMRRVYDAVLEAQLAGIAAAKAGVPGCDVHNAAWDVLKKYGYGDYFGHGFGHSLGIEIHESPNANRANTKPLPAGAVLSAEPGVYLPGKFGVRTEDVIFLTETGNRILTHAPKHLIIR
ncbi:MAG: Xaa-Pro peptidase family protein [Oscillospiraceae bacterium]